jgi:hypothetical protein
VIPRILAAQRLREKRCVSEFSVCFVLSHLCCINKAFKLSAHQQLRGIDEKEEKENKRAKSQINTNWNLQVACRADAALARKSHLSNHFGNHPVRGTSELVGFRDARHLFTHVPGNPHVPVGVLKEVEKSCPLNNTKRQQEAVKFQECQAQQRFKQQNLRDLKQLQNCNLRDLKQNPEDSQQLLRRQERLLRHEEQKLRHEEQKRLLWCEEQQCLKQQQILLEQEQQRQYMLQQEYNQHGQYLQEQQYYMQQQSAHLQPGSQFYEFPLPATATSYGYHNGLFVPHQHQQYYPPHPPTPLPLPPPPAEMRALFAGSSLNTGLSNSQSNSPRHAIGELMTSQQQLEPLATGDRNISAALTPGEVEVQGMTMREQAIMQMQANSDKVKVAERRALLDQLAKEVAARAVPASLKQLCISASTPRDGTSWGDVDILSSTETSPRTGAAVDTATQQLRDFSTAASSTPPTSTSLTGAAMTAVQEQQQRYYDALSMPSTADPRLGAPAISLSNGTTATDDEMGHNNQHRQLRENPKQPKPIEANGIEPPTAVRSVPIEEWLGNHHKCLRQYATFLKQSGIHDTDALGRVSVSTVGTILETNGAKKPHRRKLMKLLAEEKAPAPLPPSLAVQPPQNCALALPLSPPASPLTPEPTVPLSRKDFKEPIRSVTGPMKPWIKGNTVDVGGGSAEPVDGNHEDEEWTAQEWVEWETEQKQAPQNQPKKIEEFMVAMDGSSPGYVFMSTTATAKECMERELFGSPRVHLKGMAANIEPNTLLFLVDFEKQLMHGVYYAVGEPAIDIVPEAWKVTCPKRAFPAQIKVVRTGEAVSVKVHKKDCRARGRFQGGPCNSANTIALLEKLGYGYTVTSDEQQEGCDTEEEPAQWNQQQAEQQQQHHHHHHQQHQQHQDQHQQPASSKKPSKKAKNEHRQMSDSKAGDAADDPDVITIPVHQISR